MGHTVEAVEALLVVFEKWRKMDGVLLDVESPGRISRADRVGEPAGDGWANSIQADHPDRMRGQGGRACDPNRVGYALRDQAEK